MAVDLEKLKAVATSGDPDKIVGATCGYLLELEAEIRESRRTAAFPVRVAALSHRPAEVLRGAYDTSARA